MAFLHYGAELRIQLDEPATRVGGVDRVARDARRLGDGHRGADRAGIVPPGDGRNPGLGDHGDGALAT